MKVSVQSLRNGINFFEFNVGPEDLPFEQPEFEIKGIHVRCNVDRGEENIVVSVDAASTIGLVCESCLCSYVDEFSDDYTIVYAADKSFVVDDEMVRLLSPKTGELDLTEGLRESILLSLPMRFKCSENCRGLCDQCGANLNVETCSCRKESIDSRWDALRNLLDDETAAN